MGRFNKKIILLIMIVGVFLLSGCNIFRLDTFNASEEDTDNQITAVTKDEPIDNDTNVEQSEPEDPSDKVNAEPTEALPSASAIQPIANVELPVFTVDAELGDVEMVTALVPKGSEITPDLIVDTVVEAMADQSIFVGIESVTTKDKLVIVSFYKDKAPVADVGGGYEAAILKAIAQSLIDNLTDYSGVIFRIEGEAYATGHIELGIDEVYLGDNE